MANDGIWHFHTIMAGLYIKREEFTGFTDIPEDMFALYITGGRTVNA